MEATPHAYNTEAERRYHLRRLDDLLEALERLNLAEARELPANVRERLEKEGIVCEPAVTFSRLIELVWVQQERYLIDLKADRRKGARRRADNGLAARRALDTFFGRLGIPARPRSRGVGR